MKSLLAASACLMLTGASVSAESRTWTDKSGQHTVEAELLDYNGTDVRLRRADGTTITLQVDDLSDGDQRHLQSGKCADDILGIAIVPLGGLLKDLLKEMSARPPVREGVVVVNVVPGGAADRAGVCTEDVIVEIAGKPIKSRSDYRAAVAALQPDQSSPIRIYRPHRREIRHREGRQSVKTTWPQSVRYVTLPSPEQTPVLSPSASVVEPSRPLPANPWATPVESHSPLAEMPLGDHGPTTIPEVEEPSHPIAGRPRPLSESKVERRGDAAAASETSVIHDNSPLPVPNEPRPRNDVQGERSVPMPSLPPPSTNSDRPDNGNSEAEALNHLVVGAVLLFILCLSLFGAARAFPFACALCVDEIPDQRQSFGIVFFAWASSAAIFKITGYVPEGYLLAPPLCLLATAGIYAELLSTSFRSGLLLAVIHGMATVVLIAIELLFAALIIGNTIYDLTGINLAG